MANFLKQLIENDKKENLLNSLKSFNKSKYNM